MIITTLSIYFVSSHTFLVAWKCMRNVPWKCMRNESCNTCLFRTSHFNNFHSIPFILTISISFRSISPFPLHSFHSHHSKCDIHFHSTLKSFPEVTFISNPKSFLYFDHSHSKIIFIPCQNPFQT